MLSWISTTGYDVAFLGDILELWIGLGRYDSPLSSEFLTWCSRENARRRVYLLEGNHEFFVARHHRRAFTVAEPDELTLGAVVLSHGDLAQGVPAHSRFRWWSKCRLAHFLLRWMPFAPAFVRCIKRHFERQNALRVNRYPSEAVVVWGTECFARHPEARRIVLGHFHCHQEHFYPDGRQITVLPAWKDAQQVGVLNLANFELVIENWRNLTEGPET